MSQSEFVHQLLLMLCLRLLRRSQLMQHLTIGKITIIARLTNRVIIETIFVTLTNIAILAITLLSHVQFLQLRLSLQLLQLSHV